MESGIFVFSKKKTRSVFFYESVIYMQLVMPSVVAIAVSMLMAICRIVFQVDCFMILLVFVVLMMFSLFSLFSSQPTLPALVD